ncbi:bile acid:sodium symporter family protein [Tsukamurella ocularis]|uniref:bile acid:sodium symporter family protein n=1 Tax=Tsukamurella ocularis TaxID=1970234 RepID=UPI002167F48F|nr:bile acid:sodium symporter family protein [Tsukamurella ocularis]MCS3779136.1 BASS family bile acid:Na+ symporter [Tsukamurella ocularis]MCS3787244.1 BASS family bile acid:Na+ symporter [Tsukamurella ocularis]MCS3851819.1 BASS family bile acid:Na+ symporter [Tsukamurella ocularis]
MSASSPPGTPANPALAAEARIARTAVAVFPLLVLVAGVVGYLTPSTFTPLAPSVPYLLGVIMFCMGLTLTPPDLASVAKRPWAVVLGIVAHYVIMPGAGWVIAHGLNLEPELAVGVILVGCAPSGTASNVMAFLAKGDVALSVAVASVSTLIAPIVTPLLVLLLAGSYLPIDAGGMVVDIVKTVLLPVILGVLARRFVKNLVARALPVLPWASAIVIAFIVAIVVAGSASKLAAAGGIVFLAVLLHNGFGLGLGYLAGKVGRLDDRARRALAFEVGMQNSGLAATLATAHFSPLAALPSAVFSLWHNISGAVVAAWLARRPLREEARATAP